MGLASDWEPSCRLATYNGGLLKLLRFSRRMQFASFFAAKVDGMGSEILSALACCNGVLVNRLCTARGGLGSKLQPTGSRGRLGARSIAGCAQAARVGPRSRSRGRGARLS